MSVGRIDVDLSVPISSALPVNKSAGGAYWVRFHRVPSTAYVRINGNNTDAIPVDAPFTFRSCSDPINQLYVDNNNTAGKGTLVILYGDTQQELEDFLANAASASAWKPYAILLPNISNGGFTNILESNLGVGTQNGASALLAVIQDNANQRHAIRLGSGAGGGIGRGYSVRDHNGIQAYFDYLFAPAFTNGIGRTKKVMPSFRVEGEIFADIARTAGQELQVAFGYIQAGNMQENYGVMFLMAPNVLGNDNWYGAVVDYSGGAAGNKPIAGDRIVMQDLGVAGTAWHELALEMGQDGGTPYISWQIDGVEKYKFTGEVAQWPDQWNIDIAEGLAINKAAIADKAYVWTTGLRYYTKIPS